MKFFWLTILFSSFYLAGYTQTVPDVSSPPAIDTFKIYERVEKDAEFPGGDIAWKKFLTQHLSGQVPLDHEAPAGRYTVLAQFVVDKDGTISDLKTLTKWGYGMETEVLRILKLGPQKWTPAVQNGRAVKAYRIQPVTFVVMENGFEVAMSPGKDALYIGINNPVTIKAEKVKEKNLSVSISQGTIEGSEGQYNVRVTKVGRAIITIYNKTKEVSTFSLEVKAQE